MKIDSKTKTVQYEGKILHYEAVHGPSGEVTAVFLNGKRIPVSRRESFTARKKSEVHAPLNGQITKIFVTNETEVNEGDVILSLEAMKMENEIRAGVSGQIKELFLKEKATVKAGQLLFRIEPPTSEKIH